MLFLVIQFASRAALGQALYVYNFSAILTSDSNYAVEINVASLLPTSADGHTYAAVAII